MDMIGRILGFLVGLWIVGHTWSPFLTGQKQLVIVIPSYNNQRNYKKNLGTLFAQKNGELPYENWSCIYTDDCSDDGTSELVTAFVKECGFEKKVKVIRNDQRLGAMHNIYAMVHASPDDAIILTYDGDDWFAHEHVLEKINQVYRDSNVWLSYGQYRQYPDGKLGNCQRLPADVIRFNLFREYPWVTSQLRTFYAWLFKKIKKEDLQYKGAFFPVNSDLAFMFPMLEMAGERIAFVDEVLYIYNMDNPINHYKYDLGRLLFLDRHVIRKQAKYARLIT